MATAPADPSAASFLEGLALLNAGEAFDLTATREADLSRLITATRDQTRRGLAKARSLSYDDLADFAEGATNNTRDALTATLATSLDVAVDIDNKLGEIVFDGADRAGSVARRAWSSLQLENLALPDSFALDSLELSEFSRINLHPLQLILETRRLCPRCHSRHKHKNTTISMPMMT